jgi:hypothetical protein
MRRTRQALGFLVLCVGLLAPSTSFAQQSLNLSIGGFVPRGESSRDEEDVLVNNLCCIDNPLAFNVGDFRGGSIGIEYLAGMGEFFDAGLGVGYYRRNVNSVYADLINSNGREIEQNLRLRITPFTATIRFLPMGRSNAVQPYVGGGIGVFNWRYREQGEWVDPFDNAIFRGTFVANGTSTGPVILGGIRIPLGAWSFGGEVKWQDAKGDLPADMEFAGSKIDLGGLTYAATFNIRF